MKNRFPGLYVMTVALALSAFLVLTAQRAADGVAPELVPFTLDYGYSIEPIEPGVFECSMQWGNGLVFRWQEYSSAGDDAMCHNPFVQHVKDKDPGGF